MRGERDIDGSCRCKLNRITRIPRNEDLYFNPFLSEKTVLHSDNERNVVWVDEEIEHYRQLGRCDPRQAKNNKPYGCYT